MEALFNIATAFGLSTSAGLNAYIPMLLVALLQRLGWIQLEQPFDVMGSWWVIGSLAVLLLIEMLVDKIPAVDSINDLIQTLIRPAAGALLFVANANVITDFNPVLAVIAGIILAGGVHAAKGAARPVITASTAGLGNPVVSLLEDVVSFFISLLSLVLPFVALTIIVVFGLWLLTRFWSRSRREKAPF